MDPSAPPGGLRRMHEDLTRAELAAALGMSETKITAMTVAPPRYGMKPVPAYEPKTYAYERTLEVTQVGSHHVVLRRTKIWGDRRQIYSGATTDAMYATADEARQHADAARITARLPNQAAR
jgi:hypothetical protein